MTTLVGKNEAHLIKLSYEISVKLGKAPKSVKT
jgi:hypothetical protein